MTYRVGLIGTGPRQRTEVRGGGFAIGRVHAECWQALEGAELVAACDINPDNLANFASDFGLGLTYRDYRTMLQEAKLDVVDICTWPPLHLEMVLAAAEAGVKAIYCEKPMCLSLGEAQQMVEVCQAKSVRLAVSHQRRLDPMFIEAKAWVQEGRIGALREIHGRVLGADADLLSWGTHWLDMFSFFVDDKPAHSVLAQIDCTSAIKRYGHVVEDCALVRVQFHGGVRGYLETDFTPPVDIGVPATGAGLRLIGDDGLIVLGQSLQGHFRDGTSEQPTFDDAKWEDGFTRAMRDLLESIEEAREPQLSGRQGYRTTELIMAAYESANRRAQVILPLTKTSFPLLERPEFAAVR